MTLNYSTEEQGDTIIVHLNGRLDAISTPSLDHKLTDLIRQNRKKILLDFGQVDYLSSAGMRLLLAMTKQLKNQNGQLGSYAMSEDVLEIIRMAGFERILKIFPTVDEASKEMGE